MLAPRGAVALLKVFSRADGVNEITFAIEDKTRKMVLEVAAGPTLLQRMWDLLDKEMDSIFKYQDKSEQGVFLHKTRARAQAEMIALFMTPHFTTADGIAVEARRRYNARQEGTPDYDPEYETPGLGSRRYQPPPGIDKYSPSRTEKKAPTPKVKNVKALPPEAIPGVKLAMESGKFTVPQLAKMYGVSEDTVREAVAS